MRLCFSCMHRKRQTHYALNFLQSLPQPRHTGVVQAGCVRATGTTKQPNKETQFLATQQRAIPKHIPPKSQQRNHIGRAGKKSFPRTCEMESHASEGGFVKSPMQRIRPLLVNYCSWEKPQFINPHANVTMLAASWRRTSVMVREQKGFLEKSSVFAKSFPAPRTEPGDQEESKLPMNNFYWGL